MDVGKIMQMWSNIGDVVGCKWMNAEENVKKQKWLQAQV